MDAAKGDARAAAWNRYLAWSRAAKKVDYDSIEPKAWAQLQADLAQIPEPTKKVMAHAA